jgi:hypothetical protein
MALRLALGGLLTLILCLKTATALTEGEKQAIDDLRTTFPKLVQDWPPAAAEVCNFPNSSLKIGCSTESETHITSMCVLGAVSTVLCIAHPPRFICHADLASQRFWIL